MSPFECSVHTHSTFCDGRDTLEKMMEVAYTTGVRYYGASSHSHTPWEEEQDFVLPRDLTPYREEVMRLREQYEGKMEVLYGLEWDSHSVDLPPEDLDYWIGSVHSVKKHGLQICVDMDANHLQWGCNEFFGGDFLSLVEAYYDEVARVAAMKPTILGHIDLITKLNKGNRFFDPDAPRYRRAALDALHAIDTSTTALEINTGAVARGYCFVPYPARFLLKEWCAMDGEVIVTADAHAARSVTYAYGCGLAQVRAVGYHHTVILTRDGFKSCTV